MECSAFQNLFRESGILLLAYFSVKRDKGWERKRGHRKIKTSEDSYRQTDQQR